MKLSSLVLIIILQLIFFSGYSQREKKQSNQKVLQKEQKQVLKNNSKVIKQLKNVNPKSIQKIDVENIVKDDAGNVYKTVKIGEQVWMSENLAYLPEVSGVTYGENGGSNTDPLYYVYNHYNGSVNEAKNSESYRNYGVLYNWSAAMQACPVGWHLPSDKEWEQLALYVSGQKGPYSKYLGTHWNFVGKHLKAQSGWLENRNGTDDFGFNGLPGGRYSYFGNFLFLGKWGYWWSSTEYNIAKASYWYLGDNNHFRFFHENDEWKMMGYSVRCIKDN